MILLIWLRILFLWGSVTFIHYLILVFPRDQKRSPFCMFWIWSILLFSWNFLLLSLLLILITVNVLNFGILLAQTIWVLNFLVSRVSHLRDVCVCMDMDICMREWELTHIFSIRPDVISKEGIAFVLLSRGWILTQELTW